MTTTAGEAVFKCGECDGRHSKSYRAKIREKGAGNGPTFPKSTNCVCSFLSGVLIVSSLAERQVRPGRIRRPALVADNTPKSMVYTAKTRRIQPNREGGTMNRGFHLTESNAPRKCRECGEEATAYLHGDGFYCGDCADVPDERAPTGDGRAIE